MILHCFQNGLKNFNHWVTESFGIDNNTSATILITLFVFIAGGLINVIFQYLQSASIRRARRRIVLLNIHDLIVGVRKQGQSYCMFSDQLNKASAEPFDMKLSGMCEARNLIEMGYEVTFNAFFPKPWLGVSCTRKVKLKAFHKLWQILEIVTYWQRHATDDYNQLLQTYNDLNDRRNEAVQGYQRLIETILLDADGKKLDPKTADLLGAIQSIHQTWAAQSDRTFPTVMHQNLVGPVRDLAKTHKHKIMVELLQFLGPASLHYQNMANLLEVKRAQFFFYHILFKSSARQLQKISLILS